MVSKSKAVQVLTIEASSRQKAKGIALTGVKVPKKWLLPAADGTKPFTPVIDQSAFTSWQAAYSSIEFLKVMPTVPLFMGGLVLQGMSGNFLLDVAGWGVAGLSAGGGIIGALRSDRRGNRRREAIARYADEALDRWLLARYNLKIKHVISYPAGTAFLLNPQLLGTTMVFVDEQDRHFKLVYGVEGLYVEERKSDAEYYAISGAEATVTQPDGSDSEGLTALLTGDAQALHERMVELLGALDQRPLSSEVQHVIKRVREDLRATLIINRDLQKIGGDGEESRAELAAVFSALNDELDEVLHAERNSIKQSIAIQAKYVKERRRNLASGLLLTPKVVESTAEMQPVAE